MKKKLTVIALSLGLGLYASDSRAKLFTLRVTDYGNLNASNGPVEAALIDFINTEVQKVEDQVNEDIPVPPPKRFMEGMANSSVMAGKGIGSDYASNMSVALVGAGVGVAADLEKDKTTDSDVSGVGLAPGAVLGFNLGTVRSSKVFGLDPKRLNLYVNFMKYTHDQTISDKADEESSASLGTLAYGVHLRYDWIKGKGSKLLGWGGVKVHLGYEFNKTDISFRGKVKEELNETSAGATISGTSRAAPTIDIRSKTHSIPLELSTDVQLLYFVSLYTGLGADANFGSASAKGSLNAEEMTINCTSSAGGHPCNPTEVLKANASADIDGKGSVNPFTFRGFAGLQLNLPFVRIFGQVDKSLGDELVSATAGVRFVY